MVVEMAEQTTNSLMKADRYDREFRLRINPCYSGDEYAEVKRQ